MKRGPGWTRDPVLHLIMVSAVLAAAAMVFKPHSWHSSTRAEVSHPPGCHACAVCPPGAAAMRDAYLIRTGSMAADDDE